MEQARTEQFFSLVLSGGSTPREVLAYLAGDFNKRTDWKKLLIFWGDERCVPPVSNESNYRMAKESLLDRVPIPRENIFRIRGEDEPIRESERYAELVRDKIPAVNHIPRFDLVMLGLGGDGHTASIFPGNLDLFNSDKLFEAAINPYTGQKRISATGRLINHARTVVFIVTGESKAEMVARVIERKVGSEYLPAAMVDPADGELLWLMDECAARELEQKNG